MSLSFFDFAFLHLYIVVLLVMRIWELYCILHQFSHLRNLIPKLRYIFAKRVKFAPLGPGPPGKKLKMHRSVTRRLHLSALIKRFWSYTTFQKHRLVSQSSFCCSEVLMKAKEGQCSESQLRIKIFVPVTKRFVSAQVVLLRPICSLCIWSFPCTSFLEQMQDCFWFSISPP